MDRHAFALTAANPRSGFNFIGFTFKAKRKLRVDELYIEHLLDIEHLCRKCEVIGRRKTGAHEEIMKILSGDSLPYLKAQASTLKGARFLKQGQEHAS